MTHVTCRLTAKNRDTGISSRNPTLRNRVRATFTRCLIQRQIVRYLVNGAAELALAEGNKCIAVGKVATPLRELTCRMGSHGVTCHPAEVTFPPFRCGVRAVTYGAGGGGHHRFTPGERLQRTRPDVVDTTETKSTDRSTLVRRHQTTVHSDTPPPTNTQLGRPTGWVGLGRTVSEATVNHSGL